MVIAAAVPEYGPICRLRRQLLPRKRASAAKRRRADQDSDSFGGRYEAISGGPRGGGAETATVLRAGFGDYSNVFAVGFALGAARLLVVALRVGEAGGVLVELPVMLSVSWIVCDQLLDRFRVVGEWSHYLEMGGVAFGLLMMAEFGVSILAFGRSVAEYLDVPLVGLGPRLDRVGGLRGVSPN
jgi:hypothetical protein